MLILGIETATEQVSVALGGHEGVIALFEMAPRPAPRRGAHAGHRLPVRADRHRARRARPRSPSTSGRGCSPACASAWPRPRRWPWRCGPDDRHLVARPAGVPSPAVRPRRRARDRRPQGRGVLRDVPAGARWAAAGRRAACRAGRRARRRPAGPQPGGAVRRRRRPALPDRDPRRLPLRDRRRRPPVGRAAGAAGPRPGAARGVGQPVRDPSGLPAPARRPDQLGQPHQRGGDR